MVGCALFVQNICLVILSTAWNIPTLPSRNKNKASSNYPTNAYAKAFGQVVRILIWSKFGNELSRDRYPLIKLGVHGGILKSPSD